MQKGSNMLACDRDGAYDPYVRVSIWDQDLLFIIPFDFMERILHSKKVEKKEEDEEDDDDDGFLYASPTMRGNGAKTGGTSFAAIDLNQSVVTGLSMPQYAQDAIANDLKTRFNKDFSFEVAGSAKSLHRQISDLQEMGNLERVVTENDNVSAPVLSIDAAHERNRAKSGFNTKDETLTIRFRVFDHDIDDDDDFMGSHKARIIMSDDTSEYHKNEHVQALLHDKHEKGKAGTIQYRIFLNAVQIYQEHQLKYIDQVEDVEIDENFEIYDTKPQEITDAFRM